MKIVNVPDHVIIFLIHQLQDQYPGIRISEYLKLLCEDELIKRVYKPGIDKDYVVMSIN